MSYRTTGEETVNVLNAHMNARCEDDNCDKCRLNLKYDGKSTYCNLLYSFAEMFFIAEGESKGEKYNGDYSERVKNEFKRAFGITKN